MISIDLNMATRFLDLLGLGENFTFQTFGDRKVKESNATMGGSRANGLIRVLHGRLDQHADQLAALNADGAGVFVTVNETDGNGRAEGNVVRVRAVYVDLDGAPLDPVLKHTIPPSITVESSPDRFHAYWLTDDCPREQFKAAQKRLIFQFGGDPSVCDLPRVMRLPGFIHQKSEPFVTRILFPE